MTSPRRRAHRDAPATVREPSDGPAARVRWTLDEGLRRGHEVVVVSAGVRSRRRLRGRRRTMVRPGRRRRIDARPAPTAHRSGSDRSPPAPSNGTPRSAPPPAGPQQAQRSPAWPHWSGGSPHRRHSSRSWSSSRSGWPSAPRRHCGSPDGRAGVRHCCTRSSLRWSWSPWSASRSMPATSTASWRSCVVRCPTCSCCWSCCTGSRSSTGAPCASTRRSRSSSRRTRPDSASTMHSAGGSGCGPLRSSRRCC